MIFGTVGTVVSLAVAAVVSLWCRHKQKRKFAATLQSVRSEISSSLDYCFVTLAPSFALIHILCIEVHITIYIILMRIKQSPSNVFSFPTKMCQLCLFNTYGLHTEFTNRIWCRPLANWLEKMIRILPFVVCPNQ